MWTLRIILIILGVACLAGLYFYMRRHPPHGTREEDGPRIEPEWRLPGDEKHIPSWPKPAAEPCLGMDDESPVQQKDNRLRPSAEDAIETSVQTPLPPAPAPAEEICALAVRLPDEGVPAQNVQRLLARLGCKPDRRGMYRFAGESKQTLYSIANLFEPGILHPLPEAAPLRGLVFFFTNRPDDDNGHDFDLLLGAARDTAAALGGQVQDAR
ncbi:MAG: hypothetical protein L0I62_08890, partial [Gammaproteobacteria bacterium]|nr:hypothetical protein [Gammaproteobacteria bacterium]